MVAGALPLLKPPRLCPGDGIGLVCPADSADVFQPRVWQIGVDRLRAAGYEIIAGRYLRTRHGHAAGTPAERAADVMAMFTNPRVQAILAVLGGFNSHQLLPLLDYDIIRRHPKILMGFSDVTALANGIHARTGLVTFVGPVFGTFCQKEMLAYTEDCFRAVVVEARERITIRPSSQWAEDAWHLKPNLGPREWQENLGWVVHRAGRAEGISLGGNLSTLRLLAGTPYVPSFDGAVLFVEEDECESPAGFDRSLTHLRQLGVMERLRALVIGRFPSAVRFTATDTLDMILQEATRGYDFPIVSGVDFSHTDPLITIPLGVRCEVDTADERITYLEAGVEETGSAEDA